MSYPGVEAVARARAQAELLPVSLDKLAPLWATHARGGLVVLGCAARARATLSLLPAAPLILTS
eukprot:5083599-Pleurochrysis_carterae.AAC.3